MHAIWSSVVRIYTGKLLRSTCDRRVGITVGPKIRLAIVGSGPAGFYTAHQLIKVCFNIDDYGFEYFLHHFI